MAKPWEGEGLGCRQGNPSSSHACGAGPFFSLWEKNLSPAAVCHAKMPAVSATHNSRALPRETRRRGGFQPSASMALRIRP